MVIDRAAARAYRAKLGPGAIDPIAEHWHTVLRPAIAPTIEDLAVPSAILPADSIARLARLLVAELKRAHLLKGTRNDAERFVRLQLRKRARTMAFHGAAAVYTDLPEALRAGISQADFTSACCGMVPAPPPKMIRGVFRL
jgi:hypothetical protein